MYRNAYVNGSAKEGSKTNMEIYYDQKENKEAIYDLWQRVFQDPEAFAAYYFQWVYPENQVLLARDGAKICSMLHLNPYRFVWNRNGKPAEFVNLHYIVGVATTKDCRRQGLMAACMSKALRDMEEWGEPVTYLMPARTEYYEPFQFVAFKEEKRWVRKGPHWIQTGKGAEEKDHMGKPVFGRTPDIFPERSPAYLERLKAEAECEGGGLLEWDQGASYCAYVIEERTEGRVIVIQQMVAAFGELEQILNQQVCPELCRRHGKVSIEYMEEEPMMLRILHLPRFLELLPYDREEQECIVHVKDSICTGNQGDYKITLSKNGGRLQQLADVPKAELEELPEYWWDMEELTRYLLKESRLSEHMYLMEIV